MDLRITRCHRGPSPLTPAAACSSSHFRGPGQWLSSPEDRSRLSARLVRRWKRAVLRRITATGQLDAAPVTTKQASFSTTPTALSIRCSSLRDCPGTTRAFDALPGGRFVGLVAKIRAGTAIGNSEMRIILNWLEELKRIVPVN